MYNQNYPDKKYLGKRGDILCPKLIDELAREYHMLASNLVLVGKTEVGEERGVTLGSTTKKKACGSILLEIG